MYVNSASRRPILRVVDKLEPPLRGDSRTALLQIDRQTKRSFKTPEAARSAALEIKARFPALQVSIYDSVSSSRTIVDASQSSSRTT